MNIPPSLDSLSRILHQEDFSVTLMGSGTSTGVPEVGCYCATCLSSDSKDHRTRTSLLVTTGKGKRLLIDCSPDFKEQAVRFGIDSLDAIILTHDHYDHIAGLDDLRTIAWNKNIHIYGLPKVIKAIRHRLYYYFGEGENKYAGTPRLFLHEIGYEPLNIEELEIVPIRLIHGKQEILGYRIAKFVFITDLSQWISTEDPKMDGVDCCMINALRFYKKHPSHQTIEEAVSWLQDHKIPLGFLIHLSHHCPPHKILQEMLPQGIFPSYDGLSILFSSDSPPVVWDASYDVNRPLSSQHLFEYKDLKQINYAPALQLQEQYRTEAIAAKKKGMEAKNYILFCEHNPVLTLGKHAKNSNLLVTPSFLESKGIEIFHIERGGDITYHGPGQITGYLILDLEQFGWGIKEYIYQIEACIIELLALHGIDASRMEGATGVWLDVGKPNSRKICAIGVHVSRYVTMHGFALNVNTDLSYFNLINPCGFTDKGVTSMQKELQYKVHMDLIKHQLGGIFRKHLYRAYSQNQALRSPDAFHS